VSYRDTAKIRWMIRRDLPEVIAIDAGNAYAEPWTEDDFLQAMRSRGVIGRVIEVGDRLVGFAVYELRRRTMVLLNLAVAPDYRRFGLGRLLVADLKRALEAYPDRRDRISLRVNERNMPAQKLFQACGFRCYQLDRGFYDNGDDALRFTFTPARVEA
jgi:ribosomal-protein-alanine N-acetyltransferase